MTYEPEAEPPSATVFGEPAELAAFGEPAAATGEKRLRSMSPRARRIVLSAIGVLGMAASIVGFLVTSDVFEDRTQVMVSARDIAAGDVVSAADLTFDLAKMGGIAHIPWSSDAPFAFAGLIAAQDIPAGSLVLGQMMVDPGAGPVGDELEMIVPMDTSLNPQGVAQGDLVLLIDPGADPTEDDDGRPRTVIRTLELRDFDGANLRLLVPPEEWGEWRALLAELGTPPMVLPVPLGGDADPWGERIASVWLSEWESAVAEIEASRPEPKPRPEPGELEFRMTIDTILAPDALVQGDRVLLVDPGREPTGLDEGRPRKVIHTMTLDNYTDGVLTLFVEPEDWISWQALPDRVGGPPMALPIAAETDANTMARRLDAAWRAAWVGSRELLEADASGSLEGPITLPDPAASG